MFSIGELVKNAGPFMLSYEDTDGQEVTVNVALPVAEEPAEPAVRLLVGDLVRAVRQLPARPDVVAGVAVGILLQVVLVLRLGLPEGPRGRHLGDHLARPQAGGVDVGDRVLGDPLLLITGVEDGRAVA